MYQLFGLQSWPLPTIPTGHGQGIPGPGQLPSRPPGMEAIGLGSRVLPPCPCGTGTITVCVKTVPGATPWAKATGQHEAAHHLELLPLLLSTRIQTCPQPRWLTPSPKSGCLALSGPFQLLEPVVPAPSLVVDPHPSDTSPGLLALFVPLSLHSHILGTSHWSFWAGECSLPLPVVFWGH